jgi:hypothetical protein
MSWSRRRRDALPAARCVAIAKTTGQQCSNAAVRGMFCVPHSSPEEWKRLNGAGGKTTGERRRARKAAGKAGKPGWVTCPCGCGHTFTVRFRL